MVADDGVTDPNDNLVKNVDSLMLVANDSLGTMMLEMINQTIENADSSFRPDDIDFTALHNMYESALASEPSNNDARFGAAFTGLMSFMGDDAFNDLYDRVEQAVDSQINGVAGRLPQVNLGRELMPGGIPLTPGGLGSLYDPLRFRDRLSTVASGDPQVSELQDIFETRLLPLVAAARAYLTALIAIPGYEFELTPAMQGDLGASSIFIDRSDFRIFLASAHLFESAIQIFLSRNLDVGDYTIENAVDAARRDTPFLDLRTGSYMADSKTQLLSARSQLVLAIDDLLAEYNSGEDQSDDLIQIGANDIDDLNEIRDSLVSFGTYFDGPHDFEVIYNERWDYIWYPDYPYYDIVYSADTLRMTVNVSEFFDNPVNNPKSLLPAYTLSLDTLDIDYYNICYNWSAASFNSWAWPNPTVNGLFPGLTSDSLNTLMDITELDWSQSDCEIFDLR